MPDSDYFEKVKDQLELLKSLKEFTDIALASAIDCQNQFSETEMINWAVLSCVRVYAWMDNTGEMGYTAQIKQASPDAWLFCAWVEEKIYDASGVAIKVQTEWYYRKQIRR